jgi:hypothetical protein
VVLGVPLFTANMLVVALITLLGLYFAQARLAQNAAKELQRDFQSQLAARHNAQQLRLGALLERCRALVRRPRIHAALADDALELLYPNSEDDTDARKRPSALTEHPGDAVNDPILTNRGPNRTATRTSPGAYGSESPPCKPSSPCLR